MKKIIILIPVFNDWQSLIKLINEININLEDFREINFDCFIVNDASTISQPKIFKPKNIREIKILNMRENRGHARCNAFGIRYIYENEKFDKIILMDGDGEDRPVEIKNLIKKSMSNPEFSVVAKRIKRSEGPFFQFLYKIHKLITLIFTGKKINFGNYSCLIKQDIEKIKSDPSLWSSYSGTVKKNIKKYCEIDSVRGLRYFGPSQMSLFKLLVHSFSIIGVFKYQVFFRSAAIFVILIFFEAQLGNISIFFQILLLIFNLIILIVSFREKKEELDKSHTNLSNITVITNH